MGPTTSNEGGGCNAVAAAMQHCCRTTTTRSVGHNASPSVATENATPLQAASDASPSLTSADATALHAARNGLREPVTIASAETIGKDQTAGSDPPDHQLVTRYVQNRDLVDWAIFVGKIIMAQPTPLSALSTAN